MDRFSEAVYHAIATLCEDDTLHIVLADISLEIGVFSSSESRKVFSDCDFNHAAAAIAEATPSSRSYSCYITPSFKSIEKLLESLQIDAERRDYPSEGRAAGRRSYAAGTPEQEQWLQDGGNQEEAVGTWVGGECFEGNKKSVAGVPCGRLQYFEIVGTSQVCTWT